MKGDVKPTTYRTVVVVAHPQMQDRETALVLVVGGWTVCIGRRFGGGLAVVGRALYIGGRFSCGLAIVGHPSSLWSCDHGLGPLRRRRPP